MIEDNGCPCAVSLGQTPDDATRPKPSDTSRRETAGLGFEFHSELCVIQQPLQHGQQLANPDNPGLRICEVHIVLEPPTHGTASISNLQQQTAATNAQPSGSQCAYLRLARQERRSTRRYPPLCKQDVRVRVSPTVLQRLLMPPSRGANLSFSLIRNRSAGFMIGCHACNRRLVVCSGH
jgi:hypothetical protein